MTFVVVVNVPGTLPEEEPVVVETLDEAREVLVDAIATTYRYCEDEGLRPVSKLTTEASIAEPGAVIYYAGYAHCLMAVPS